MKTQICEMRPVSLLLPVLFLSFRPDLAPAQQPREITLMASRLIGGSASVEHGTVRYENSTGYGLSFDQNVEKNVNVEFSYFLFPTQGHFDPSAGSQVLPVTMDFTIHYLQFGAAYHALTENVQPFISTTCGVIWFRPGDSGYSGDWRFAFSTLVGIKLFVSQNVGFRLQGRAIFPVYFSNGGLWAAVSGTGSGFQAGIRIVQTDLAIGLIASF